MDKLAIGVTDLKSEVAFYLRGCLEAALLSLQVLRAIALLFKCVRVYHFLRRDDRLFPCLVRNKEAAAFSAKVCLIGMDTPLTK